MLVKESLTILVKNLESKGFRQEANLLGKALYKFALSLYEIKSGISEAFNIWTRYYDSERKPNILSSAAQKDFKELYDFIASNKHELVLAKGYATSTEEEEGIDKYTILVDNLLKEVRRVMLAINNIGVGKAQKVITNLSSNLRYSILSYKNREFLSRAQYDYINEVIDEATSALNDLALQIDPENPQSTEAFSELNTKFNSLFFTNRRMQDYINEADKRYQAKYEGEEKKLKEHREQVLYKEIVDLYTLDIENLDEYQKKIKQAYEGKLNEEEDPDALRQIHRDFIHYKEEMQKLDREIVVKNRAINAAYTEEGLGNYLEMHGEKVEELIKMTKDEALPILQKYADLIKTKLQAVDTLIKFYNQDLWDSVNAELVALDAQNYNIADNVEIVADKLFVDLVPENIIDITEYLKEDDPFMIKKAQAIDSQVSESYNGHIDRLIPNAITFHIYIYLGAEGKVLPGFNNIKSYLESLRDRYTKLLRILEETGKIEQQRDLPLKQLYVRRDDAEFEKHKLESFKTNVLVHVNESVKPNAWLEIERELKNSLDKIEKSMKLMVEPKKVAELNSQVEKITRVFYILAQNS